MSSSILSRNVLPSFDDKAVRKSCRRQSSLLTIAFSMLAASSPALAAQPTSLVSACSGVSLPPSVVTNILSPVLSGIVAPIQNTINPVLGVISIIPIVGQTFPPLNINVTGLLNTAASGAPISLSVLDNNGTIIGPGAQCNTASDSFQLNTPAGISIGGNRITGLGSNNLDATAGELGSIAFGNSANTAASAVNAIAIGTDSSVAAGATGSVALGNAASVSAVNSAAIGANSAAGRGAQAGYAAIGLVAPQTSVGEVSVGSAGNARQITNVAAGSAPTDAVNVSQLAGVGALATNAVQYDVNGVGTRLNSVTLAGGAAGPVTVTNVGAGALNATSTDAVNGAQLFATNGLVATNTTNTATNTTNIAGNTTNISNLGSGAAGTVQRAPAANTLVLTAVGGTGAAPGVAQILSNAAAGALSNTSTDAVNGSQLFATNGQVTTNTTNIAGNTTNISNLANGTTGLVRQVGGAPGVGQITVGAQTGGTSLSVAGTNGTRTISGLTAGVAATDAVNVSQLASVSAASANAVKYDVDVLGNRLNTVTLAGGVAGPVSITNVAAGALNATSGDAVNGAQLFATNTNVAAATVAAANANLGVSGVTGVLGGSYNSVTGAYVGPTYNTANATTATTVQGAFNNYNAAVSGLSGGTLGLVQQAGGSPGAGLITIGAATGGTAISIAGTGGNRTISGVSAGVAATDAANVGQVTAVGAIAGNSVQYDKDGAGNKLNSVTLAGGTAGPVAVTNVAAGALNGTSRDAVNGAQLFATNTQVTNNSSAITTLTTNVNSGAVGPVQRTGVSDGLKLVAAGGTAASPGNAQTLGNVAAGAVTAASTDAVNGGQLFATNTNVATAATAAANANSGVTGVTGVLGGAYNQATGAYTGPTYSTVNATTATTVQGAFNNYNSAISGLSNGTIGLVQQATPTAPVTVAAATGGTVVNVKGIDGTRTVTGVSAGVVTAASTDAVNGAQLFATNAAVTTAQTTATNAGNGVAAVAAALGGGASYNAATGVSAAPNYTIQGGTYTTVAGALNALDGVVATTGPASPVRGNNTAGRAIPISSGTNATAGGFGAVASGASSLALGTLANSSGTNSVALGAGSSDGGQANVVSVGSTGAERRITNVATAINATDAINLGQATALASGAVGQANGYTDSRIGALNFDLSRKIDRSAASAAALAGVPQAVEPGRGFAGVSIGGRGNAVSLAFGLSTVLTDEHNIVLKTGLAIDTRGGYATYNAGVGFHF